MRFAVAICILLLAACVSASFEKVRVGMLERQLTRALEEVGDCGKNAFGDFELAFTDAHCTHSADGGTAVEE